jgi:glycogen debranching enzyme
MINVNNEMERMAGDPSHILAASSPTDERRRVLKHGDTFAVFDHYGDIKPGGLGEEGLYHEGTRFLSCLVLELEGTRPFFLSSTVQDENDQLAVALTNPDLLRGGHVQFPLGTLHLAVKKFLWREACYQQFRVKNHGREPVETQLLLHFGADFADIYEVRGMKRKARGRDLDPVVNADRVVLGYRGRDAVMRRTVLNFEPGPSLLTSSLARFNLTLRPKEEAVFNLALICEKEKERTNVDGRTTTVVKSDHDVGRTKLTFDDARAEAQADLDRYKAWSCHVRTSNGQINAWINRAISDLHMMTTELPTGSYPYAGVPWFNTPFGRDGIITALV